MKVNEYKLLEQCVETGIQLGWNRAYKHNDNPDKDHVQDSITQAIMQEIAEWFTFGEMYEN